MRTKKARDNQIIVYHGITIKLKFLFQSIQLVSNLPVSSHKICIVNVQCFGIKSLVQLEVIELMAMKTELFSHSSGKLEPNNFK